MEQKDKWLAKIQEEGIDILKFVDNFCEKNKIKYYLAGGTLLGAIRHDDFIPWDDDIDIAMPRDDYERFIQLFPNNERYVLDSYKTNKKYWLPFAKVRKLNTEYVEHDQEKYSGNKGIWLDIFPLDNANRSIRIDKFRFYMVKKLRYIIAIKMGLTTEAKTELRGIIAKIFTIIPRRVLTGIQSAIMGMGSKKSIYYVNLGSQYGFKKQRHPKEFYIPSKKHRFGNNIFSVPGKPEEVLKQIYGSNYMALPPLEKRTTHNPSRIKFSDGEIIEFK